MHILLVLNHVRDLEAKQTSALLIQSCLEAGHTVTVCGIRDLQSEANVLAGSGAHFTRPFDSPKDLCTALQAASITSLERPDLVFLRTNPARDDQHFADHLKQLTMLAEMSVAFVNHPRALLAGLGKTNLAWLDRDSIPLTWITPKFEEIEPAFGNLKNGVVVKPLQGTRGEGIIRVLPGQSSALAEAMRVTAEPVVQEFLPEVDQGDLRVVVMRGKVLTVDGQAAVIRRRPQVGNFRTNLHQGGTAHAAELTQELHVIATRSAEALRTRDIALAGLDFVGNKIIEINIFATGGLKPARDLYGKDFCAEIVRQL